MTNWTIDIRKDVYDWTNLSETNITDSGDILHKNCRPEWPDGVCVFGNMCGLTSTATWFIVLFPQIVKNWKRKSVIGLSILWATANFTASLINLFFVFRVQELPIYMKISAIYMPALELSLLIQFWIYGSHYDGRLRWFYLLGCLVMWAVIVLLEVVVGIYEEMQWGAIVLWSIETFPQVILNMQRTSTSGQSTISVCIALFGKTTDFLSTYLLVIPLQFVIMAYFSSSMAYINGMQIVWYWRNRHLATEIPPPLYGGNIVGEHGDNERYVYFTDDDDEAKNIPNTPPELEVSDDGSDGVIVDTGSTRTNVARALCSVQFRITFITLISLMLLAYAVGLYWNTESFIAIMAPLGIVAVMIISYIYRKKVKGY